MAKLTKLERAKRQTRKKFRGILKGLSEMNRIQARDAVRNISQCGVCNEYTGGRSVEFCSCPF